MKNTAPSFNNEVMRSVCKNFPISTEVNIKLYEPLLNKLAIHFGFGSNEAKILVQKVAADIKSKYAEHTSYNNLRIYFAKEMVHECIFIISTSLFNQNFKGQTSFLSSNMPLTYHVVFILYDHMGFSEMEISEILNIPPIKVRERLNKAISFNKHL
jgi:hypothetical protein